MAEYKGRHVKITLENGHVFEGFVHSTNETTHKLTLEKVTDCNTKTRVKGLQHFFAHEMESIEALEDQIRPKTPENDTIIQDKREQGPKVLHSKYTPTHLDRMANFKPTMRMLKTMSSMDEENTKENRTKLKNSDGDSNSDQDLGQSDEDYIVISKLDHKFDQAIHCITRYGVIGVAMEGVCIGRSGTLCWLQIGTNDHTFLFDILTMGPECFEAGLKGILEDTNILKVMHDCRLPSDILHHQYQVSLVNVFDTQVADVFVYRLYHGNDWPRYVQGLPACLFEHLNLAQEQIHNMKVRHHLKKEDQEVWQKRPLPRSLLDAAAKNVKHLRELRIVLTEKMMAEYVAGVDVYLSHIKNASKDDARKHQANPQLLPLGFRDLNSVMMTSRDFYFMNREKTVPKDSSGFRENCTGVGDPDVVFSRDSIWHTGQRKKGSVYFNQYQKLLSETKCEDKVLLSPTMDNKSTTVPATDATAFNPKLPTDVETSAKTGGEDQPHITQSQGDSESLSVINSHNDIKNNSAPELAITGDLKEVLDGSIKTAGRRMRELMSKDKFFNTGCDSLENYEIRPAGTWQISGKSKRKTSGKTVADLPDHNSNIVSVDNKEMSPSSSVIDTPVDLKCDMMQDSITQSSESRTNNLNKVTPIAESSSSGSEENSGTSGSETECLGHSISSSHLHNQKHSPPSPRAVHRERSVFSDSESCFSGKISPQLAVLGRGRGMTFSPRTNDSIRNINNHQGNMPYSCVESKVRKPSNQSVQDTSASQAKTWGTFIQKSSSETDNNDEIMEGKVSPILKLNSGLLNGNSKLTNLRLLLGAYQKTKE